MQVAYLYAWVTGFPESPDVVLPVVLDGEPPHPAASSATPVNAAAAGMARRMNRMIKASYDRMTHATIVVEARR
jgi:hypothetical protein